MVATSPETPHPPTACAQHDESVVGQSPHEEKLNEHGDDEEDEEP